MSNAQELSLDDMDRINGGGVFNVVGNIVGGGIGLGLEVFSIGRLGFKKIFPENFVTKGANVGGGLGQKLDDVF